jgi:hypothetical protein
MTSLERLESTGKGIGRMLLSIFIERPAPVDVRLGSLSTLRRATRYGARVIPNSIWSVSCPMIRPEGAQGGKRGNANASPFSVPQITLPEGGGGIRVPARKFAANPATGTGSHRVPIPLGFRPPFSVPYDSAAAAMGFFGAGWAYPLKSFDHPRYGQEVPH